MKKTYTDDEIMTLLKKPDADCKFCEYRNFFLFTVGRTVNMLTFRKS